MNFKKYLLIVALVFGPFASQLHAQTLQGIVAGASAMWLEAGTGAYTQGGTTTTCVWTEINKSANNIGVYDSRAAAYDYGKTWVVWTAGSGGSCAAPTATSLVLVYVNLDSGVGNRCLFASPSCTLWTSDVAGNSGTTTSEPLGLTDTALPQGVLNAIYPPNTGNTTTGLAPAPVTIAATDILPWDSWFSTYQTLASCGALSSGTQYQGYGYGPGNVGTQIQSQTGALYNVINWALTGTDPITGNTVAGPYTVTPVGAAPILVFVNTANASGFGSSGISNADRATLGLVFGDILVRTADLVPQTFAGISGTYYGITAWHREPLSGTYQTFERAIPDNKELYRPQESGNCNSGSGYQTFITNPLNVTRTISDGGTTTTGTQLRALSTSEEVSQVQATEDSIGYAFWSSGNFKSATYGAGTAGDLKYLTVDGVDPLFASYSTSTPGEIPTKANGLLPSVTLQHIQDGSYPIWSELRFITTASGSLSVAQQLSTWTQGQVTFGSGATQPDFIAASNLNVFHMHFALPFGTDAYSFVSDGPRVCGTSGPAESGGDAGGLVTTIQAGADYAVLKGNYNTSSCPGITNAASFGTHQ